MNNTLSLYDKFITSAQNTPDKIALYECHRRTLIPYTCLTVLQNIAAVRSRFTGSAHQRIGLLCENSAAYLFLSSGILAAGKDLALLDTMANTDNLIHAVKRSDLDAIVYDTYNADLAHEIHASLPALTLIQDEIPDFDEDMLSDIHNWHEGNAIFYTSGTSKSSKIVITPISAIEGNIRGSQALRAFEPDQIMMIPLPLYHSFGFTALHSYYQYGCPVCISSMRSVRKDLALVRPTHIALVPSAVDYLLKKNAYPNSLKYMVVAGSYFAPALAHKIQELGIITQNLYGSSEVPVAMGMNLACDDIDALTMQPDIRVTIAADGEVIIDTPYHFLEYYKNPADTSEVIINGKIHTGDIGYLDEKHRLHLLGRRKHMLVMDNGEKIFYTDLDESLRRLPGIEDAAVLYEDGRLIAAIAPKKFVTSEEITHAIAQYNATQPVSQSIRDIWIYGDALPYTSSGKLQRSVLEQQYHTLHDIKKEEAHETK